MNCKPGDLAIQVHSNANNHGALYTVLSWVGTYRFNGGAEPHHDCWNVRCEQRVVGTLGQVTEAGGVRVIPDTYLRPIRDPGDDARDESLAWLPPVPNTTKETA
jgi:hypothetical protein